MTAFAASQRLKNIIKAYFGETLRLPRNFRAKMYSRTKRGDTAKMEAFPFRGLPRLMSADPS